MLVGFLFWMGWVCSCCCIWLLDFIGVNLLERLLVGVGCMGVGSGVGVGCGVIIGWVVVGDGGGLICVNVGSGSRSSSMVLRWCGWFMVGFWLGG